MEEGIVGLQGMGLDDDFVGGGVAGDDGLGGLAETASEAALVDQGSDVPDAEGAGGESALHALGEVGGSVEVEQAPELLDFAFEIDAAAGDLLQIDAAFGGECREAIASTGSAARRAPLELGLDVRTVLDGLPAPPAARVIGDDGAVGEDADGGVVGA